MASSATPLAFTDRHGTAYRVWDVLGGERRTPGVGCADARVFVRDADGWAFTFGWRGTGGYPADTAYTFLQFQLSCALDGRPVRQRSEDDAAYTARCKAHRIAHTAAARAHQEHIWARTATVPRACVDGCPTCAHAPVLEAIMAELTRAFGATAHALADRREAARAAAGAEPADV